MKKSLLALIALSAILASFLILGNQTIDEELLARTFTISAVFYDDEDLVSISYQDKTNQTQSVVLEVIGLNESFQKKYASSIFVEHIPLSGPPEYGWSAIPVTFLIEHKQLGKIELKTEISSLGKPTPRVIYSKP